MITDIFLGTLGHNSENICQLLIFVEETKLMHDILHVYCYLNVPETFRVKIFSAFYYFPSCWKYFYTVPGNTCTGIRNPVALNYMLYLLISVIDQFIILICKKKHQLSNKRIRIPSNFIYLT